ncbi:antibiotic biosynthesis monooxygenase [Geodermatophilus sp. DSM 44513]|uniref:antibiotic biosynthesis monooxygenase family protein n=1 Tax=Geodermatophilus sp. DSM 44513 TaxID=1528104 RepID=UPI0012718117|nr:antibiotic biosynthesis monooxygenase [Geodermatophilus sp. DSM 44513]WNV75173.1 antibiotic biosynthesis monooxygenase [Geodermatophilus sp. DSM 44513]
MSTDTHAGVTFINVIDVEPAKQQAVVDILKEGTEKVIRHRPGFLSVRILASKDGTKVVNYAQWRSVEDVQATQADADAAEYAKRAAALATAAPNVYFMVAEYQG